MLLVMDGKILADKALRIVQLVLFAVVGHVKDG